MDKSRENTKKNLKADLDILMNMDSDTKRPDNDNYVMDAKIKEAVSIVEVNKYVVIKAMVKKIVGKGWQDVDLSGRLSSRYDTMTNIEVIFMDGKAVIHFYPPEMNVTGNIMYHLNVTQRYRELYKEVNFDG